MNIWKVSQSPKLFKQQEYEELLQRHCVCVHPDTPAKGSASVTQGNEFYNVKKGDYFYLCYGNDEIRLFGKFTGNGDYSKLKDKSDWFEQEYELIFEPMKKGKYQDAQWWWTPNDNSTFIKVTNNKDFERLIMYPFFNKTLNDIINMDIIKQYEELLLHNYNLILTGAPGTGKTYLAKEIAKKMVSGVGKSKPIDILINALDKFEVDDKKEKEYEFLLSQFYQRFPADKLKELTLDSYCVGKGDRENFCYWIERKLSKLGTYFPGTSKSYLVYWNSKDGEYKMHGYLKNENPSKAIEILANDLSEMVKKDDPSFMTGKLGESMLLKIMSLYYPDKYAPVNSRVHINNIIALFNIQCDSDNIFNRNKAVMQFYKEMTKNKSMTPWSFMQLLYDSFNISEGEVLNDGNIVYEGEYIFVQFHPSYDYTDFVEGLRPIKEDGSKEIGFERKNGIFKGLCAEAKKNPKKKYVLIIDEINRGEISKIFGELFFSIDPGYRGEDGIVKTQYQNLVKESDEFYEGFYVPKNIYIIGTMNDIDRSVESMDFAFRRRFAFKEIKADDMIAMLDDLDWKDDAIKRMQAINARIEKIDGLSRVYHIGPAYFLKLKNYDGDFDLLWENHLEGLLLEYMRGMTNCKEEIKELAKIYRYTKMDRYE